jgi:stress-induced morphogen
MPLAESDIAEKIKIGIPDVSYVSVSDESDGCGSKFDLVVVSETFKGKPLLAQQRLVNKALEEEMKTIHALTMKCYTPEKYEAKKVVEEK